MVEHFELFEHRGECCLRKAFPHEPVMKVGDVHGSAIGPVRVHFVQMHLFFPPVVQSPKFEARPQRPVHRYGTDLEYALQFVQEGQGVFRRPVQLVHEREDRYAAAPADREELACLLFDAFGRVDDHHDAVDSRQDTVGVFGEILVTGRVEKVDAVAVVVELEHSSADGDAACSLQFHPVGCGLPLVAAGRDGSRQLNCASIEEQLLGKRGLSGVWMRNDGERASPTDLFMKAHVTRYGKSRTPGSLICRVW